MLGQLDRTTIWLHWMFDSSKIWQFDYKSFDLLTIPRFYEQLYHPLAIIEDSSVRRFVDSTVPAFDYSMFRRFNHNTIRLSDDSTIRRFDGSTIPPVDYSLIRRFDNSTMPLFDYSTIGRFGHSTIQRNRLFEFLTIRRFVDTTCAYSKIRLFDNSTIR